jgi:hypothetical protein
MAANAEGPIHPTDTSSIAAYATVDPKQIVLSVGGYVHHIARAQKLRRLDVADDRLAHQHPPDNEHARHRLRSDLALRTPPRMGKPLEADRDLAPDQSALGLGQRATEVGPRIEEGHAPPVLSNRGGHTHILSPGGGTA